MPHDDNEHPVRLAPQSVLDALRFCDDLMPAPSAGYLAMLREAAKLPDRITVHRGPMSEGLSFQALLRPCSSGLEPPLTRKTFIQSQFSKDVVAGLSDVDQARIRDLFAGGS